MLTKNQSAQMGFDICGGGRKDYDIHIHGDELELQWEKNIHDVIDRDGYRYRDGMRRIHHRRHDQRRRAPTSSSPPRSEKKYSGYMLVYVRREDAESLFEPISSQF